MSLRRAERNNPADIEYWRNVLRQYDDWFQVSGFAHPKVIIYTNNKPFTPEPHTWGLVPGWAKSPESIWNNTLNAKVETMFEKSSFQKSAGSKRCIIPAEGFYEHHYFNGKTYPFYIAHKEGKPFYFAGLWNDWANPDTGEILNTFTIVTTRANTLMTKIHNKPKFSDEPRMPVILPDDATEEYLRPLSRKEIEELCVPFPDSQMVAHTVKSLSGKNSPGNVPEANEKYFYPDLVFDADEDKKWTLF
ncbi:MAG TPA: SOS response-associated peptidase [Draconibacterium sp.]|nr:SOS response-associated peptidase [Draconibacterium sp.]